MIHKIPHMLLKLFPPAVVGAAIFGAQVLDEHATVPLFTMLSIFCSSLVFTWATSAKLQKFIDRLEKVENGDKALKDDVSELRKTVQGIKFELQELSVTRSLDMEQLRMQLKAGALMQPMAEETGMRVLIVDDDENDAKLLRSKLIPTFAVDTCLSLRQANDRIKRQPYDCVLLDFKLPDARFNRTVEDFVADNPDTLCIVITGMNDEVTRKLCLEQGADDVWVKGVDDADLRVITRRLKEAIWRKKRR